ncbi:MAG: 4Fe-4S dicluster domain-containing protein [Tannerella sp.]|jgi:ferredoxin|nr:4Fe-4S dicluster domain-containing protein [Tannerella sp.]
MNAVYIGMGIALLLWTLGYTSRRHKNRNKIICAVESNCTGCGRCIKRCSRRVLETIKDETKIHVAVKYPDRCTACGDCLGKCKFNALILVERR